MKVQFPPNKKHATISKRWSTNDKSGLIASRRHVITFPWLQMLVVVFFAMMAGPHQVVFAQQNAALTLCQQQIDILNNKTDYTELYSSVIPVESVSGNDVSVTADYSAANSAVAAACAKENAKLYTTNEKFSCDVSNGGKLSLSFVNIGICVGLNCSTSYLDSTLMQNANAADSIFSQATSNVTESLTADGLTNCQLSFSAGNRVFVIATGVITSALYFFGNLVVMAMV